MHIEGDVDRLIRSASDCQRQNYDNVLFLFSPDIPYGPQADFGDISGGLQAGVDESQGRGTAPHNHIGEHYKS